ncbi:MAG: extensin family protein, partial [Rubricella sp.]
GGGVCGDPRIEGEVLSRIDGPGACGIDRPVRLTRVSGIAITGEQVVSCAFAREFADWAEGARFGTGAEISSLQSYAGYTCRTRNGLPGERISNHAFGNAIDIGVIGFANGERVSVEDGWNDPAYARIVRTLHGTACSDFDTVLGPEFDAAHRNHLHFDIDPDRRGGAFCR